MKHYFKSGALTLIIGTAFLSSCKKDNEKEQILERETVSTRGIYVLCEGSWNDANSIISYYDVEKKTTVKDYYKQVNGTALGETANDLKVYGSKLYCVVSGVQGDKKSFLDVMNVNTGRTIKRISFNTDTEGKMPRFITFYKNKAYVSNYDGTISRIDTASLTIEENLQLKNGTENAGALEGLAVANGKLYVANSVHGSYPNSLKDKITIIDLATFTKTKDITVTINPVKIAATESGDILVVSWGVYGSIDPTLQKISSTTDAVTGTYSPNVGALAVYQNQVYLATDWGSNVISFNVTTGTVGTSIVQDGTTLTGVYGITVNPFDQNVVVADALTYGETGKAFVFGQDGKVKYSFETGPSPQAAAFNYNYRYVYKPL